MSYKVLLTPDFQKDAKKLLKKYPSLKNELLALHEQLEENPVCGTQILENVYKVRLAIKSKNKGKSGGARTIHFIYQSVSDEQEGKVYLLTIYDKSDYESVSNAKLEQILEELKNEIGTEEE
jgi:mRNA-degrading endonuclease RelE of RelBE toxin-antitoxin system